MGYREDCLGNLGRARVAVPVPIGPPDQVEVVIEIFGELDIEGLEGAEVVLADFAGQLFSLLRGSRPDPAIERLRQHLAEVVRGTQDAVLSKDLDGIVTTWNPAAERLYGYSAEEAIGRHISFLVPPDHKDEEKGDPRPGEARANGWRPTRPSGSAPTGRGSPSRSRSRRSAARCAA